MKRRGFLIEQIAQTDNLLLAYYKASKGKHTKHEVIEYEKKLEENISNLQNRLLSNNVHIGDYTYFQIHDPKLRTICAASFSERVLHHAIMNICHPDFEKRLIDTTYASRKNKGTYVAIDRAKKAVRKYEYVGKFDVRHYFDSIDHRILIDMLNSMFKDDNLMQLLEKIISSYHTSKNKGLPIGNLTSQYFANHYLCKFDHYCKENLGVQEYIRYYYCPVKKTVYSKKIISYKVIIVR